MPRRVINLEQSKRLKPAVKGKSFVLTKEAKERQELDLKKIRKTVAKRFSRTVEFMEDYLTSMQTDAFINHHTRSLPKQPKKEWVNSETKRANKHLRALESRRKPLFKQLEKLTGFYYLKNPPLIEADDFFKIRRKLLARLEEIEQRQEILFLFKRATAEPNEKNATAFFQAAHNRRRA